MRQTAEALEVSVQAMPRGVQGLDADQMMAPRNLGEGLALRA